LIFVAFWVSALGFLIVSAFVRFSDTLISLWPTSLFFAIVAWWLCFGILRPLSSSDLVRIWLSLHTFSLRIYVVSPSDGGLVQGLCSSLVPALQLANHTPHCHYYASASASSIWSNKSKADR
jgi:hypothetical protein